MFRVEFQDEGESLEGYQYISEEKQSNRQYLLVCKFKIY